MMTVLAKSLIVFGILTSVDGREPLKAHDSPQNERELSSTENDRDHLEHLVSSSAFFALILSILSEESKTRYILYTYNVQCTPPSL